MAKLGYKLIAMLAVAALPVVFADEANAQRGNNPNLGHFYMARQQWQVTDDSPVIRYQGGGAPGPNQQMAPQGPAPLPRAGFQQHSHKLPSYSHTLPGVVNGVPKRVPAPARTVSKPVKKGNKGKSGKWKPPAKATAANKGPTKLKTYNPYKGYDPKATSTAANPSTGHAGSSHQTKTKVRGSVLHWARGNR